MKKYFLLFFTLISLKFGYCQAVQTREITNKDISKTLASVETFNFKKGQKLSIKIFKISNGSGSANLPESDEISHNLLFCISEYDEVPAYKIFDVGPFINPIITKKIDSGNAYVITVINGLTGKRKSNKIIVDLNKIICTDL